MALFDKKKKPAAAEQKLTWYQNIIVDLHDVLCVFGIFLILYMLCFRVVVVVGPSMYDTLFDGDRLVLLSSTVYKNPKAGDIVVASLDDFDNGECIVKRVIATEGQTVDINFETGIVYVDGIALEESYTHTLTNTREGMQFPLVVTEDCLFVMGDNRNSSKDSRSTEIGLVDKREILGKAIFLLLPGDNRGTEKPNYDRIGVIG